MEGTGFLAVAVLIAALGIMAGFWMWQRRSRTRDPETAPRTAVATLRISASQVTRSDRDVDSGSFRPGPSVRTTLTNPTAASIVIPAGPALSRSQALDQEVPPQTDTPEVASAPLVPGVPIPPLLLPPVGVETAPLLLHGDETVGHELILQPAERDPFVLETDNQTAETATGDIGFTAHRDGAASLPSSFALGDADPAEADGPDDSPPEGTDEQSDAEEAANGGTDTHESGTTVHQDGAALLPPSFGTSGDASSDATNSVEAESLDDPLQQENVEDQPDADQQAPPCAEPEADMADFPSLAADEAKLKLEGAVEPDPSPKPNPTPPLAAASPAIRPRQPAVHRDRRGKHRAVTAATPSQPVPPAPGPSTRPPAEARLRLSLHPIRRTARLSVLLTRPDGFPARVTVLEAGGYAVEAYDERRYDDLDLPWTSEFLMGELRLMSADCFQWLCSARQVYIFAPDPNEADLISASAARAGITHTLICRSGDAETIRLAAAATGSPELQTHGHWQGIPDGWLVLSGYTPVHAAVPPLPTGFRTMDPGEGLEISFDGGLAVRGRVYAAGHPPCIIITPTPGAASVTIGGMPAERSSDGAWTAPGWERPGQHMIDIVPGPSVSYEIAADPWLSGGWDFWDAHPQRFSNGAGEPWTRARICGALIRGPTDETVFAAETQPTVVALGARAGATPLRRRADAAVSVGLMAEPPEFLLSATGSRRTQGHVVWLGLTPTQNPSRRHDPEWVAIVRSAAARRLPLVQAGAPGDGAWRKAKERARRLRNKKLRP